MPRERLRVCLQDGLKLDLNCLIRRGLVQLGGCTGPLPIQWLNSDTGEVRALGLITANLRGHEEGWFHFKSNSLDQWVSLVARPRHFGGKQWYFICPATSRLASVLWKPPGARQFCSRHAWERRKVAYRSFESQGASHPAAASSAALGTAAIASGAASWPMAGLQTRRGYVVGGCYPRPGPEPVLRERDPDPHGVRAGSFDAPGAGSRTSTPSIMATCARSCRIEGYRHEPASKRAAGASNGRDLSLLFRTHNAKIREAPKRKSPPLGN
jgi:hypothetical protein